jgi:hypothetical protein
MQSVHSSDRTEFNRWTGSRAGQALKHFAESIHEVVSRLMRTGLITAAKAVNAP